MMKHYPFFVALIIVALAAIGGHFAAVGGFNFLLGVAIPYLAAATFLIGFTYRVIHWARSPVPFNITTTAGQQASLDWIPSSRFESPSSKGGVLGRMFMEVFFFRSLFRNTKARQKPGGGFGFVAEKTLWFGALLFHWAFFLIFLRHLRYFVADIPFLVAAIENIDGLFQVGLPVFYLTDAILLLSVSFLLGRRITSPQLRYITYTADYFPLLLILAIGVSGIYLRYGVHVDIIAVKSAMISLVSFQPILESTLPPLFYTHLFLVSLLFAYFPFSKLVHAGGVWFSPTRNMRADSRNNRHENPWNYPVKKHSYEEYENEFREQMEKAGLPISGQSTKPKEEGGE